MFDANKDKFKTPQYTDGTVLKTRDLMIRGLPVIEMMDTWGSWMKKFGKNVSTIRDNDIMFIFLDCIDSMCAEMCVIHLPPVGTKERLVEMCKTLYENNAYVTIVVDRVVLPDGNEINFIKSINRNK